MADITTTRRDNISIGVRTALAVTVAAATAITWALVWDLGFSFVHLAMVLGAPPGIRVPAALVIGWFLQWIVAALSLFLILALFFRPLYMRAAVQAWFITLAAYAIVGVIAFRDLRITSLLAVIPALGVVGSILYLTGVRPNMRLKLTARVD